MPISLKNYTFTSALNDSRFRPINELELPFLRVSVSLLIKYEECGNCYDWIVGEHGILIKFVGFGQNYNATYLPEVAADQEWDQKEAIESLVRKAGFTGIVDEEFTNGIHCTRYQSSKECITYDEYCRENVRIQNY